MSKRIVITGAGAGLGRALARRFAADGHSLILLGRTLSKVQVLADELGNGAIAIACDVADPNSVRTAFAEIAQTHAEIDVLINNAAIYYPITVRDVSDERIIDPIMTNFAGVIFCCRSALGMMGRGGQILNVSSEVLEVRTPMFSMYRSTKAGMEEFSAALRAEVADDGIRVTVVRCGQMYDQDSKWDVDPETSQKFHAAAMKAGIDLRGKPISQYASVAEVFSSLVALPADVQIPTAHVQAYRA